MNKIAIYLMAVAVMLFASCNEELDKDKYKYQVDAKVEKVELNLTELEIARNATATLTATISPSRAQNKDVTWSSSNETVAVVMDGVITAREIGTANITVTTEDGSKTATCEVTVVESVATQVRINKTTLSLNVGEEETLTVTFTPGNTSNKEVSWKSSDAAIATVSQWGEVKALAPGKTTITVTSVSGGRTHTCEVTVIRPVTGVKLNQSVDLPVLLGETFVFKATVEPADASNKKVTWRITGNGIVITDYETPGEVTVKRTGEGVAVITVITDDGEFDASCKMIEKPFYPNSIAPFSATMDDNFEWGNGYSGRMQYGTVMFSAGEVIPVGAKYELEIEFTVSRDFEEDELYVAFVDTRQEADWWTVKGEIHLPGVYKAGETISKKFTIEVTEATTAQNCNIHFETEGEGDGFKDGKPGTPGSGVKGPITVNFTKFVVNKL